MLACTGSESPEDAPEKKPPSISPSTLEEEESPAPSIPSTLVPDSSAGSDSWSGSEDGLVTSFQSTDSGQDLELGSSTDADLSASIAAFSIPEPSLPYGSDYVLFATSDAPTTLASTPEIHSTPDPESPATAAAAAEGSETNASSVVFDAATLAAVEQEAAAPEAPQPAAPAEPEPAAVVSEEAKPESTAVEAVTESQPELVTAAVVEPEVVHEGQPEAVLVIKPGSPKPLGPSLVAGDGVAPAAVNFALYSKNGTAVTLCL